MQQADRDWSPNIRLGTPAFLSSWVRVSGRLGWSKGASSKLPMRSFPCDDKARPPSSGTTSLAKRSL